MVGAVMRLEKKCSLACAALMFSGSLWAEGMADPTRPPAQVESPAQVGSPAVAATGLQTVIIRPGRKSAALINGEYVELGGKIGEAKLVSIRDDHVVLQGPAGREVLRLTPGVEKMPVVTKKINLQQDKKPMKEAGQ